MAGTSTSSGPESGAWEPLSCSVSPSRLDSTSLSLLADECICEAVLINLVVRQGFPSIQMSLSQHLPGSHVEAWWSSAMRHDTWKVTRGHGLECRHKTNPSSLHSRERTFEWRFMTSALLRRTPDGSFFFFFLATRSRSLCLAILASGLARLSVFQGDEWGLELPCRLHRSPRADANRVQGLR